SSERQENKSPGGSAGAQLCIVAFPNARFAPVSQQKSCGLPNLGRDTIRRMMGRGSRSRGAAKRRRASPERATSTLQARNLCPNFNLSEPCRALLLPHPKRSQEASMWKAVLAGTTAVAIAGTSLVFAQAPAPQEPQQPQVGSEARSHWRPSEADFNALTDARIAAIKTGLKLTPDQEKNWPAVEQAIRDLAKDRYQRRTERRNQPRPADPI